MVVVIFILISILVLSAADRRHWTGKRTARPVTPRNPGSIQSEVQCPVLLHPERPFN